MFMFSFVRLWLICFMADVDIKQLAERLGTLKCVSVDSNRQNGCNADAHAPNEDGWDCPHCECYLFLSCHVLNGIRYLEQSQPLGVEVQD